MKKTNSKLVTVTVKLGADSLAEFDAHLADVGLERDAALRLVIRAFNDMRAEEGCLKLPLMIQQVPCLN